MSKIASKGCRNLQQYSESTVARPKKDLHGQTYKNKDFVFVKYTL
jgi:hypothetical protein